MKKPSATPRKKPRQARSLVTVEAILEAAAHILAKDGYAGFTTNRVAERAGVSIGSLYQYYPNKQSLLAALHARHLDQIMASGAAILRDSDDCSLAEALDRLVGTIVSIHLDSDGLHRVVAEETPESLSKATTLELVRNLLDRYQEVLKLEDPDLVAYMLSVTTKAVIHGTLRDRPEDLRERRVERELVRMFLAYLSWPLR